MSENNGYELGWDSAIENDGPEFILLPEGDYDFEITNFERGRHAGSDKLPPCNKATVYLRFETDDGVTTIKHNLFLHSITEGMLCSFFIAIGQRKHGEKITMNWNGVVGSRGRARVGIRNYKDKNLEDRKSNEIKKFYEPDSTTPPASTPAQGFEPGRF